jgi:hypothetical protein
MQSTAVVNAFQRRDVLALDSGLHRPVCYCRRSGNEYKLVILTVCLDGILLDFPWLYFGPFGISLQHSGFPVGQLKFCFTDGLWWCSLCIHMRLLYLSHDDIGSLIGVCNGNHADYCSNGDIQVQNRDKKE